MGTAFYHDTFKAYFLLLQKAAECIKYSIFIRLHHHDDLNGLALFPLYFAMVEHP